MIFIPDMTRVDFAIVVIAALVALASASPVKFEGSALLAERSTPEIYRLPSAVVPHHYNLSLVPWFEPFYFTFEGHVDVSVTVRSTTNVLILHNDGLTIRNAVIALENGTILEFATQSTDTERQFEIFTFTANLPLGAYYVSLDFSGILETDMDGLYVSSYQVNNETRWLVASQFQPTSARKAFPCFDEPGLKSTFTVRVGHFANETALTNMPVASVSAPDAEIRGRVWTTFETTPVMSTYLLAFVVSDFASINDMDSTFNVWARPSVVSHGAYAMEIGQETYTALEEYLGVRDEIPKIDHVAVPDFSAGAMENWGLVLYRESLLLYQDGESTSRDRQNIATIIAHELAHFWFGNLVSPVWWNDLWFNEGLATYFEYHTPITNSTWRLDEQFVVNYQLPSLVTDSRPNTRPMNNVVGSPASILASFDGIAYAKSASIFRMLNRVMSDSLFATAIGNFLRESAYGTFNSSALWAHMQAIADANSIVQNHIPLGEVMDSYVNQAGYPLVTVTRNYSTLIAVFSQERFYINRRTAEANPSTQRWWIPITIAFGLSPTRCNFHVQPDWIRAQDEAIIIGGFDPQHFLLENCQGVGYHRTNYDVQNWNLLAAYLNSTSYADINPVNRAILIDDALNLARGDYIHYSVALNLIAYLSRETDYIPWAAAVNGISYLNNVLAHHTYNAYWHQYLKNLITNIYEDQGWDFAEDDGQVDKLFRALILNLACSIDHDHCRHIAAERFNAWISSDTAESIHPDLKATVYCWGIRAASAETWDELWNRFLSTDLSTEQLLILRALGCSSNSEIIQRYLQLSITVNSGIRSQDTLSVFAAVLAGGPDNLDIALDFLTNNFDAVLEFYGGLSSVSSILASVANRITTEAQLSKFENFIAEHNIGDEGSVAANSLLVARANIEWVDENASEIGEWLTDNLPELPVTEAPGGGDGAAAFTTSVFCIVIAAVMSVNNYVNA